VPRAEADRLAAKVEELQVLPLPQPNSTARSNLTDSTDWSNWTDQIGQN
jgi:hypothetical protein